MTRVQQRNPDIDGGWAWVILVTSFLSLMLVCGALYSVSVFNVIFLSEFQASKTSTSLVGSVLIGLIAFMGPVSSSLSNRYGWRVPIILGGVIASFGTFLSSFAQNMTQLTITYGVISGIGHGLCYTPAIVVVGYYFETYRTMASGFASVGAGVGMMVFPPLIRYLRLFCTWRELFVYIACIYAQICVLGALMRPLPKRREDDVIDNVVEDVTEVVYYEDLETSSRDTSADGLYSDNVSLQSMTANNGSVDNLDEYQIRFPRLSETSKSIHGSQNTFLSEQQRHLKADVISIASTINRPRCRCSKIGIYFGICCNYSCACSGKHSKLLKSNMENPVLLNGGFTIFCLSIFMFGVGLSALYVHLSAFAISHGASETESSFIVTILGIASIISRIMTGIAGNDDSIDNTILYIGSFGIAGICTIACPFIAFSYAGRMIYTVLFGFYGSCFNVLLAPITVEIIGLNHLSTAFGIEMVINGVAYFLGPPLAGVLYDLTNSYDTSFFLAGSCLVMSSIIMMFVGVFNPHPSNKKNNHQIEYSSNEDVEVFNSNDNNNATPFKSKGFKSEKSSDFHFKTNETFVGVRALKDSRL